MTPTEIFTDALIELGRIEAGESLSPEDLMLLLRKFNRMLGTWNTQKRFVVYQRHQQFEFGTSQQVYTIGVAADSPDFEIDPGPRPLKLETANLVLAVNSPPVNLTLYNLQVGQYSSMSVPNLAASIPTALYYEPAWPLGKIYPWPYPQQTSNSLELWWWQPLTKVVEAQLSAEYVLPEGYEDALILSLAEQCSGNVFGVPLEESLVKRAREARNAIATVNSVPPRISTLDAGMPRSNAGRGWYNWRTGNNYPT